MNRTRYIVASFVAPLAALLVPCIFAVSQLYAEADIPPDGSSDDAAMRGAGTFLVVAVPVLYLVAAVFYASAGHLLARTNSLRLKTNVLVASLAPWALVAVGLVGSVTSGQSVAERAAFLAIIGTCMSVFAALGAIAWWYIAVGPSRGDA